MSAWNSDPVVLTVAVTGADVFRENNPNIPYTTEEIADSSIEAGAAGATVVHLHVREDDGTPSGRPELFKDVIERIRAGSDLLTMVSTGGSQRHDDRGADHRPRGEAGHLGRRVRLDELRRRDLHHAARGRPRDHRARDRRPGSRSRSRRSTSATWSARCAGSRRASCRRRCGSTSSSACRGASTPRPRRWPRCVRPLPSDAFWTVTCIGRHHPRMLALALLHGAPGIRTGLEDVAYLRRGVLAPSNAALVEMAVGLAGALGREVATRSRPGALAAWLTGASPRARARCSQDGRASRRRGPRPARRSTRPRSSCSRGSATTRPRCAPSHPQAGVQPAAIYHWYPSKEAILVGLQDDFMERLTEKVVDGHRAAASARRCGWRPRCASTSSSTASHRRAAFVTDSEIRALDRGAAPRADRQARRLPGDVQRHDPRRHPRRLAARLGRARRHLRDPAPVHGRRALVRPARPADARAGRRAARRAGARLAAGIAAS